MKIIILTLTVLHGIVAVIAGILYKRMVGALKARNLAMRTLNESLRYPGQFALFRKEFGDKKHLMRLWWAARIFSWLTGLLGIFIWVVFYEYILK